MSVLRKTDKWVESHTLLVSVILAIIFSPLIVWAEWETIIQIESIALRVGVATGTVVAEWVVLYVLLVWNRWVQKRYRRKGIIK